RLSTNPPGRRDFVDNPVDGPRARNVRSHPALGRREGNAVHEGHGETRPRNRMDRGRPDDHRFGARRVDAGSGAAPRGTHGQGGVPLERRREPLPTRVQDTPPLPSTYHKALDDGLASLGLDLTPDARGVVDGHARLLLAWTAAINLTAIREPRAVALGHVVDSLTSVPVITARRPRRLLDLGSGGGYPGI